MLDDEDIAKKKYKYDFILIICELLRDVVFVVGVLVFIGLLFLPSA